MTERAEHGRAWDIIPSDLVLPQTEPIDMTALISAAHAAQQSTR